MTESAVTAEAQQLHGRNRITPRAIRTIVSAITATELGTPAKTVGVELSDDDGTLVVTATAPVRVASLISRGTLARRTPQPSVLERAAAAQNTIRRQVLELTGSAVGVVNLRLTSARIDGDEQVI